MMMKPYDQMRGWVRFEVGSRLGQTSRLQRATRHYIFATVTLHGLTIEDIETTVQL